MINVLLENLRAMKRNFKLMAPTGRAAKVIAEKTHSPAYTVHKSIYSFEKIEIEKGKGTNFKYQFKIRKNDDDKNTIYIIDEASMISNKFSEGEFFRFGSGELLTDLFNYIHQGGLQPERKILFVGDPAQLPPINTEISPALNLEMLEGYGFNTEEFTLSQIVRQKEESGILIIANDIRSQIDTEDFTEPDFQTNYDDVSHLYQNEFLDEYLSSADFALDNNSLIISYSNKLALHYNKWIRSHFFPYKKEPSSGDRIMITTNNYSYPIELLNGDFGKILEVSEETESPAQPVFIDTLFGKVQAKGVKKKVNLVFRDCLIRFTDLTGKEHDIECKIFDNLLYSSQRDISAEERKALVVDFQNRHPKLKPGTDEFAEAISMDEYVNALRIKFGYAITGHKSQGGEWENVFIDTTRPYNVPNESYFRWLYTSITRAKNKLCFVLPFQDEYDF